MADRRVLTRVARECHAFSPQVATSDDCPDAIWLDVMGLAHLYGGEEALLTTIAGQLAAWGWTCQLALADSFAAAWALARYRAAPGSPLLAPEGAAARFVAELPVEALQLSAQMTESLWKLGLRDVGQVAALSRRSLASSLEATVVHRLDGLHAAVPEALQAVRPRQRWEAAVGWELPLEDGDILARELERLCLGLAERLARDNLGATQVRVRLSCPPADPVVLDLHLFCPSVDGRQWQELALLQLERRRMPAGVAAVDVVAREVAPRGLRQLTLFATGGGPCHDDPRTSALLARLTSRLGERAVARPELVPDAQPERAWRGQPLTAPRRRRAAARSTGSAAAVTCPERPATLLPGARRPLEVRLGGDGRLAAFVWRNRELSVARSWGPERIETGWWRGGRVARDYHRVELDDGARAWLFRRLHDGAWFLHGWFD